MKVYPKFYATPEEVELSWFCTIPSKRLSDYVGIVTAINDEIATVLEFCRDGSKAIESEYPIKKLKKVFLMGRYSSELEIEKDSVANMPINIYEPFKGSIKVYKSKVYQGDKIKVVNVNDIDNVRKTYGIELWKKILTVEAVDGSNIIASFETNMFTFKRSGILKVEGDRVTRIHINK